MPYGVSAMNWNEFTPFRSVKSNSCALLRCRKTELRLSMSLPISYYCDWKRLLDGSARGHLYPYRRPSMTSFTGRWPLLSITYPFSLMYGAPTLFSIPSLPATPRYQVDGRFEFNCLIGKWITSLPCIKCDLISRTLNCGKQKPRLFPKMEKYFVKKGTFIGLWTRQSAKCL